ncbi:MAG: DNA-3-methyladenine glycosylase 2 family protein [Candidatus Dormibacteraeota bacterium]|nr:DNA-3-methyladenine glycosylase 2 family protein [Candidatus Dormibacteraeota bacterium]
MEQSAQRTFRLPRALDLPATLRPLLRGPLDPTLRFQAGAIWRASRTPLGPARERLWQAPDGSVHVAAWGPGAEWLLDQASVLCGGLDDDSDFRPVDQLVSTLHRQAPGLRLARTEAVWEATAATILEQRVTGHDAWRSWRLLVRRQSEPAPGPGPELWLPPLAERVARLPLHDLAAIGVEAKRAAALRRAATLARRLEAAPQLDPPAARRLLLSVPGVGLWSAAEVTRVALGDADAVPVGDYHVPHQVAWALAAEPRGNDERMLELLEPYRGHRGRVLALLNHAGIRAPAYGPRMPLRDISKL